MARRFVLGVSGDLWQRNRTFMVRARSCLYCGKQISSSGNSHITKKLHAIPWLPVSWWGPVYQCIIDASDEISRWVNLVQLYHVFAFWHSWIVEVADQDQSHLRKSCRTVVGRKISWDSGHFVLCLAITFRNIQTQTSLQNIQASVVWFFLFERTSGSVHILKFMWRFSG
jgi:hypothetical protein